MPATLLYLLVACVTPHSPAPHDDRPVDVASVETSTVEAPLAAEGSAATQDCRIRWRFEDSLNLGADWAEANVELAWRAAVYEAQTRGAIRACGPEWPVAIHAVTTAALQTVCPTCRRRVIGLYNSPGDDVFVTDIASESTLAHELGHFLFEKGGGPSTKAHLSSEAFANDVEERFLTIGDPPEEPVARAERTVFVLRQPQRGWFHPGPRNR